MVSRERSSVLLNQTRNCHLKVGYVLCTIVNKTKNAVKLISKRALLILFNLFLQTFIQFQKRTLMDGSVFVWQ